MIVLPFKIRVCVHLNYMNMEIYYLMNFLFVNFLCGKAGIYDDGIKVENKNNHIFKKGAESDEPDYTIQEYIKRIKVVNINFYKEKIIIIEPSYLDMEIEV